MCCNLEVLTGWVVDAEVRKKGCSFHWCWTERWRMVEWTSREIFAFGTFGVRDCLIRVFLWCCVAMTLSCCYALFFIKSIISVCEWWGREVVVESRKKNVRVETRAWYLFWRGTLIVVALCLHVCVVYLLMPLCVLFLFSSCNTASSRKKKETTMIHLPPPKDVYIYIYIYISIHLGYIPMVFILKHHVAEWVEKRRTARRVTLWQTVDYFTHYND